MVTKALTNKEPEKDEMQGHASMHSFKQYKFGEYT